MIFDLVRYESCTLTFPQIRSLSNMGLSQLSQKLSTNCPTHAKLVNMNSFDRDSHMPGSLLMVSDCTWKRPH